MTKQNGYCGIVFATKDNTSPFYFLKQPVESGEPVINAGHKIGVMSPSMFRWSNMRYLYDIYDAAYQDKDSNITIIESGDDMYTAIEFLRAIAASRMWSFEMGIRGVPFTLRGTTSNFFFTDRKDDRFDYTTSCVGTATTSFFKWEKMRHLYDVYDAAYQDEDNLIKVVRNGTQEYTAVDFLNTVAQYKIWLFNVGL